jgi:hypothetical protein
MWPEESVWNVGVIQRVVNICIHIYRSCFVAEGKIKAPELHCRMHCPNIICS